jgi:hypothetical protein
MNHTFIISIDDGDCCYKYPLTIVDGDKIPIRDIYKSLCTSYNAKLLEGIYCPSEAREVKKLLKIE